MRNSELHNLYSSASVIRKIKSKKMGWVGHIERMQTIKKCVQNFDFKA
jgi:alkyl sulfatase BDS1-like metallo-beta-lactamase superfamily hydrolase